MNARQRGQAMVEFAIILPVLIALLLGGADLLMALSAHQTVTYVAEQAAECMATNNVNCLSGGVNAYAQQVATGSSLRNPLTLIASSTAAGCPAGSDCVAVQYQYVPIFHFIPTFTMNVTGIAAVVSAPPPSNPQ
jgi:Flp pilus assembly protein TadG